MKRLLGFLLAAAVLLPVSASADAAMVTVTGHYLRQDGTTPAQGRVVFNLKQTLRDTVAGKTYDTKASGVNLDGTGRFSLLLVSTNDPVMNPSGGVYHVKEVIDGATTEYDAVVPYNAASGTVDVATLGPSSASVTYGASSAQLAALSARLFSTAAADWYVDPAGSDGAACSQAAPCKTVTEILTNRLPAVVNHAETIHLAPGTYTESLYLSHELDSGAIILLQGAAATTATGVSGGCPLSGTLGGTPQTSNARELAARFLALPGSPTCTVAELKGLLLQANGVTYPIAGNTATMVEFPSGGDATAAAGQAYSIVQPSTILAPASSPGVTVAGGVATSRGGFTGWGGFRLDLIEFRAPSGTSSGYGVVALGGGSGVRITNSRFNYSAAATALLRADAGGSFALDHVAMLSNSLVAADVLARNPTVGDFEDVVITSGQVGIWFEACQACYSNTTSGSSGGLVVQNTTSATITHGGGIIWQGPGWYQMGGTVISRSNAEHGLNFEGPAAVNFGVAGGSPPAFVELYLNATDGVHFTSAGAAFSGGAGVRFPAAVYIGDNTRDGLSFTSPGNRITTYAGLNQLAIKNNGGFGIAFQRTNWAGGTGFVGAGSMTDAFQNYLAFPMSGTSLTGNTAGDVTYDNGSTSKTYAQFKIDNPSGIRVDTTYANVLVMP